MIGDCAMHKAWNRIDRFCAKACTICALAKRVAQFLAWFAFVAIIATNAMLIAKVIAICIFVAIAWPLIKAMRCYIAARILLAKLIK